MAVNPEEERERIKELFRYERELWATGIRHIAGLDEAGRGPLAGPVVAAAVIFPGEVHIPGLNDSKLLTAKRREKLYDEIILRALDVGLGMASPAEIDELNILQASLKAMNRALSQLSVRPDFLLIDGCWKLADSEVPQTALIKGDRRCFSIAAASIVAKVYRDRMMLEYDGVYPQYGFDRHKGYPTRTHIEAIARHGYCEIHRRTFKINSMLPDGHSAAQTGPLSFGT